MPFIENTCKDVVSYLLLPEEIMSQNSCCRLGLELLNCPPTLFCPEDSFVFLFQWNLKAFCNERKREDTLISLFSRWMALEKFHSSNKYAFQSCKYGQGGYVFSCVLVFLDTQHLSFCISSDQIVSLGEVSVHEIHIQLFATYFFYMRKKKAFCRGKREISIF